MPGDLVDFNATPAAAGTSPGLVLAIDDGWAHVQWYDTSSSRAGAFVGPRADAWTQWHPRPKLTVISTG
jgi:hypothetical protein